MKTRTTQTVGQLRKRVARLVGLIPSQVLLRVKGRLLNSDTEYSRTLQSMAIQENSEIFASFDGRPINAEDSTSPLLVDPNVKDWRQARLTHAAEKMFAEVFARYCNDFGTLDRDGLIKFFAAVDVTDSISLNPQRLKQVFQQFDTTNNGAITYKGFIQFYTEASKARVDKVQADVEKLGYNLYTLKHDREWPEERKARAEEKKKLDAERAKEAAAKRSDEEKEAAEAAKLQEEAQKDMSEDEKKAMAELEKKLKKQAEDAERISVARRQIDGCSRREEQARASLRALEGAHPRRILISAEENYQVLMDLLQAAANAQGNKEMLDAMDFAADKAWTMLMQLPT